MTTPNLSDMTTPDLIHAHKKAVAKEERRHTWAMDYRRTYDNPQAEALIDAMKAEIDRRATEATMGEKANVAAS